MKDALGDRMKSYYENRTRMYLPRRTYTFIRVDGKAFHTYTKGFKRPFDDGLMDDMDSTAKYLCKNIQGTKFAFVQSDEISLLLTDFDKLTTDAWFDGNVQKITSVSSSLATTEFNRLRYLRELKNKVIIDEKTMKPTFNWVDIEDILNKQASFDSRVFTIPLPIEVENYFIWRQQDTERNSISSVAQSLYSHKELNGKDTSDMQEMCWQKGVNWNDFSPKYKRGRIIVKRERKLVNDRGEEFTRNKWVMEEPPIFTQDRDYLRNLIPII